MTSADLKMLARLLIAIGDVVDTPEQLAPRQALRGGVTRLFLRLARCAREGEGAPAQLVLHAMDRLSGQLDAYIAQQGRVIPPRVSSALENVERIDVDVRWGTVEVTLSDHAGRTCHRTNAACALAGVTVEQAATEALLTCLEAAGLRAPDPHEEA